MKVLSVTMRGPIDFKKSPNKWYQPFRRWYIANEDGGFDVNTDMGVFVIRWFKGFGCDGRSGGIFVDPIFPNWGTDDEKKPILAHDISFYDWVGISFEVGNMLLKALMEFFKTKQWRCDMVFKGVCTWIAKRAFGCKTKEEKENKKLCHMEWL